MLNCPKPEQLLEFVSIRSEIPFLSRTVLSLHLLTCAKCERASARLKSKFNKLIIPEPDVTSSLIRVYARLQKDETLILKGWKLDESTARPRHGFVSSGWAFRSGVALALLAIVSVVVFTESNSNIPGVKVAEVKLQNPPFAQIRVENDNRVEVRYVEPELLHSMEFETTNITRNVSHTVTR